jgi:hypothetical protein
MFGGRATPSPPSSFASHLDRLDAPPAEAPLEVGYKPRVRLRLRLRLRT